MTKLSYKKLTMGASYAKPEPQKSCLWASVDGCHETECGELFYFDYNGPKDNRFKFCPFCGKHIEESGDDELIASRQIKPSEADLPRCLECSWTSGRDGRPVLYKACDKCRPQETR